MEVDLICAGSGNVQSVANSLARLRVRSRRVTAPEQLQGDLILLPGVGSISHFMAGLRHSGLDSAIIEAARSGKRIIGICLGFQALAEHSQEDGGVVGLGLLPARVSRLGKSVTHNGWLTFDYRSADTGLSPRLTRKRNLSGRVYYNHEFGVHCPATDVTNIRIPHPGLNDYSAMVVKDNIIGCQFHPEKSQWTGSELFRMIL